MGQFHEYLVARGKLDSVKKDDKSGDNVVKGKGKGPGTDGSKAPGNKKVGDDWTKLGDKDLVIKFKDDGGTKVKGKDTIRTAENFAHYELLPLIRETIERNPLVTEDIVHELKRNGLLGLLVGELLEHQETYKHIASVMGHKEYGPAVCRKLVRAMREDADISLHDELGEEDKEGDEKGEEDYDAQDGEGVQDQGEFDDSDVQVGEDSQQDPQAPPAPAAPAGPTAPAPAMSNFQRAMMGRY